MFFWNFLAFLMIQGCWQFDLWLLCLSKSILNICKFSVHILLKPSFKNYEHYFISTWNKCNCSVVWTFLGTTFLGDWNENWPFLVLWPLLSFPNLLAYSVQHLTVSSFRIWNSSAEIPSPPVALFVVMRPKASLSLHDHLGRFCYLSLLFFGTLDSNGYIFPFLLLPLASLLFSAICKASPHNHVSFLHFFFLGMVLFSASCTMSWTSVYSSSGTLSDLIIWIYLSLPLYNCKGFDLGHIWMA